MDYIKENGICLPEFNADINNLIPEPVEIKHDEPRDEHAYIIDKPTLNDMVNEAEQTMRSLDWSLFSDINFRNDFIELAADFEKSKTKRRFSKCLLKKNYKWNKLLVFLDKCRNEYKYDFHSKYIEYDTELHIADYYWEEHRENNIFDLNEFMLCGYEETENGKKWRKWSLAGYTDIEAGSGFIKDDDTRKRSEYTGALTPEKYILHLIKLFKSILSRLNLFTYEMLAYHVLEAIWKTYDYNDFAISPRNIYEYMSGNLQGTKVTDMNKIKNRIRSFKPMEEFDRNVRHQKVYEDPRFPGARKTHNKRKQFKYLCDSLLMFKDKTCDWFSLGNVYNFLAHKTRVIKTVTEYRTFIVIEKEKYEAMDEEAKSKYVITDKFIDNSHKNKFGEQVVKKVINEEGEIENVEWEMYRLENIKDTVKVENKETRQVMSRGWNIKKLYNEMINDKDFINGLYKRYGIKDEDINEALKTEIKDRNNLKGVKKYKQERSNWHEIIKNDLSLTYKRFIIQYPEYKDKITQTNFKNIKSKIKKEIC